MTEKHLLEPSFADAVAAIETSATLAAQKRSHWVCSLHQIAKAMDKPLEIIPARWSAVRFAIAGLHHARVGSTPKTLANHKSNARAALLWFSDEKDIPKRGVPLSPDWNLLRSRIPEQGTRAKLSALMRYCSAQGTVPAAVDEIVVDNYMAYRGRTTALACDAAARRGVARAWNSCIGVIGGWPAQRLIEPPIKAKEGPAWEEFPEGLRSDIDGYLEGLTRVRRSATGKRIRPCKHSTIRTRRAKLVAFVRMAARQGVELASLTSLKTLLDPALVDRVIDAYWKANGERPHIYTIELGSMLWSIARETRCLDADALERLADIRAALEDHRRYGLTDKNLTVVRQILVGNVWDDLIALPDALFAQARTLRGYAPLKAAVTAQIAVAIAILTHAPIRLGNLTGIRLEENLIKPGGPGSRYMLVFPDYDVKNRVRLDFLFEADLTALIDEYVNDFRPALLRGANDLWLFPGAGGCKGTRTFGSQISERIKKAIGLQMTVHQFRHMAAAVLLKHQPGNYELVRRLLGHRNIETTSQFYCGFQTMQASQIFGDIVRKQIKFKDDEGDVG